eukprot:CAMPEP_0197702950 /NCGR_PEP_ID=MMETSP1338-20131121/125157_1 /TAXON_ID=43686 ORGANISM="Pelagodinium beii, Strain RCC1491" /NCGR_SAMPLE_ID=MMETSP1338 /ASSEMBLY_ACC=CAM_ASM_000754 /LENGTH=380 /DNA_ID=CAMNT_0043286837 /DNA_START=27 /DNA_END=1165 /DNA_ORIENTATION=+
MEEDQDYGMIIDAGSSKSRLNIFKWPRDDPTSLSEVNVMESVVDLVGQTPEFNPSVLEHSSCELANMCHCKDVHSKAGIQFQVKDNRIEIKPGLSSFVAVSESCGWESLGGPMLLDLLKASEKYIPEAQRSTTKLYVMATAGLRDAQKKKGKAAVQELLGKIRESIGRSSFSLSAIDVISGTEEGLYSLIQTNKALAVLDARALVGTLEVGGKSMQVAVQPKPEEHLEGLMRFSFHGISHDVKIVEMEGCGGEAILEKSLLKVKTDYDNVHPCFNTGWTQASLADSKDSGQTLNHGDGIRGEYDQAKCEGLVQWLIENSGCGWNGGLPKLLGKIRVQQGPTFNLITMGMMKPKDELQVSLQEVNARAESFCRLPWYEKPA